MKARPVLACLVISAVVPVALCATTAGAQDSHDEPGLVEGEQAAAGHGDEGAHDEHGVIPTVKQGLPSAITALVVFGAVFGVLGATVWPKIVAGLAEREKKIRDEIAAAESARLQAKDALEQYEQNLSEARAEAQKMLEQTKAEQAELAARLRAQADKEMEALRDRARRDIDAAKKAALTELYADAASLATMVAGKILEREVSAADHERLVAMSLEQLRARDN